MTALDGASRWLFSVRNGGQGRMSARMTPLRGMGLISVFIGSLVAADESLPVVSVEAQPLAANARRVAQALQQLGHAFGAEMAQNLESAARERDHALLQGLLDRHVLLVVA